MGYSLPIHKLGEMDNVGSSQLASFRLPIGRRVYQEIYLVGLTTAGVPVTSAQFLAQVTGYVRLTANQTDIVRATPTILSVMQAYYGGGVVSANGVLPLGIERQSLRSSAVEAGLALGTADLTELRVEVLCGTLVEVAKIGVYAKMNMVEAAFGFHRRLLSHSRTYSVTGDFEDVNLPVFGAKPNAGYLAIHIPDSSSRLVKVNLEVNTFPVFRDLHPDVLHCVQREDRRVPQTGYRHLAFDLADVGNAHLNLGGATDFNLKMTTSGGAIGAVDVITETVHNIPEALR